MHSHDTTHLPNQDGLCQCGCGQTTPIATKSYPRRGWVRGAHIRFINGHQHRRPNVYRDNGDGSTDIVLSPDVSTVVDTAIVPSLRAFRWTLGGTDHNAYVIGHTYLSDTDRERRMVFLHRVIMAASTGVLVDHIDGDGLNNRLTNLRFATASENQFNRRLGRDNTSGYKGVWPHPRGVGWIAAINVQHRVISLGNFTTAEDAARAYDEAARVHHGAFARLNFARDGERSAV